MGTLTLPSKGADFELPPAGAHVSTCYRVIDLGTQDTTYKGTPKKKRLILIGWELCNERMQDGRPFTAVKRYTYSSNKKAILRHDLESWRGKPFEDADFGKFDLGKLIGAGCMLNIMHEERGENTYANVTAVMRLPKGTTASAAENPTLCFSLDSFNQREFDLLSDRIKDTIRKSPEYRKAIGEQVEEDTGPNGADDYGAPPLDDEIPFISCARDEDLLFRKKAIL